jgi:xanthine dehydrogenase accessory factor
LQAVDHEVIAQARTWLASGTACWLATVVGTYGSSPRPVGSLFTCDAFGHAAGSLSGGCVEDDLKEKLASGELARDRPQFFRYGITAEETEKFGLPCGGSLDIVVEPLVAVRHLETLEALAALLAARQCAERRVDLRTGDASVRGVEDYSELEWDEAAGTLVQSFGPRYQLFVIGAGMVSRYLAQMAQALDYAVVLCDPREHLLTEFGVPGVRAICAMPDDAVRAHANTPGTAIVALTHDPRIDDMGLMEALKTQAFYVGAMGSRRTSEGRRKRLLALDVTEGELARLHAPIGLPIGSKTPPEIAIAILAEITAVRKKHEAEARAHLARITAAA